MTSSQLPFVAKNLTKRYGPHVALANLSLTIPEGRIVGLLGRNGAGKSTLLHTISGLILPTEGEALTFGRRTDLLDTPELSRLGVVQQEGRFLEWMTVRQHLDFVASFYPKWDRDLERRLVDTLDLSLTRKIVELSTGDRQKVGILLGVCHRPSFLLLDEPMSSLDPIARASMLNVLLERLRDDGCTVLISSHILNDVEKIVDWVICLEQGRVAESSAFDELQESFAEWTVVSPQGRLPAHFAEPYILSQRGNERLANLVVRSRESDASTRFASTHGVEIKVRRLSLDEMFPLLTPASRKAA